VARHKQPALSGKLPESAKLFLLGLLLHCGAGVWVVAFTVKFFAALEPMEAKPCFCFCVPP